MPNEDPSFVELSTSTLSKKYSIEERQSHCEDWHKSGLSKSEYCRQSGLAVSTLSKWLNEINPKLNMQIPQRSTISNNAASPGLEIILVSGTRLRFIRTPLSEIVCFIRALES